MADKIEWVRRHADQLRRVLMREPRGHADMSGALLTEPTAPGSHAGVIFMNANGYPAHCPATASSRSRRLRSNAAC